MDTRKRWRLGLLATLLVLATAYVAVPYRLGVVMGESMSPSMKHGDMYVLERAQGRADNVRVGDVVVFRHNGTTYLKRVLAAPGDTVYVLTFPGTGRDEFVMDWELAGVRRITKSMRRWYSAKVVSRRVPEGFFYAVGDHVSASVDSREFGPVPIQSVLGRLANPPAPQPLLHHVAGAYRSTWNRDRS
ncbi:MAG: signal peptidase I [Actinomycetota bacterium]